jgi:hypothetical protein
LIKKLLLSFYKNWNPQKNNPQNCYSPPPFLQQKKNKLELLQCWGMGASKAAGEEEGQGKGVGGKRDLL